MKNSSFRTAVRTTLCLFVVGSILLLAHLHDLGDQYGAVDYFTFSLYKISTKTPAQRYHSPQDKVIVMAKMEHEDTSWVAEELPEYLESPVLSIVSAALTSS